MHDELTRWLSDRLGRPVEVTAITRLTVGHSRAMHRVDTDAGTFVLRVEQGGVFGTSSAEEYRVMSALHRVGFPVARPRWQESTTSVLAQPFFVMDFLPGAAGADERSTDEATCVAFVDTLARLHALDPRELGRVFDLDPTTPGDATHLQIDRWTGVYRSAANEPNPLLEQAAAWLHLHAPPLARLSVVHGDAGPGNFVHADGAIVALTDWEFAHLGDPAEDWAFCLTMRGVRTLPRDTWLQLFERVGHVVFDADTWRYWEAFNLFKGACANLTCLHVFETGANPAPNMAIIGTTLHQVFLRRLVELVQA